MSNLYHKVTVVPVCTALGFFLGATLEAKAASFTLAPAITFEVIDGDNLTDDYPYDGRGDQVFPGNFDFVLKGEKFLEVAEFAEFNIGNFSAAPNMFIKSAIFQAKIAFSPFNDRPYRGSLGIFGYVGNGKAEASDFEAGVFLSSVYVASSVSADIISFDVTQFFNQRVTNNDAFAGFGIRALNFGGQLSLEGGNLYPGGFQPRVIVETTNVAEPVPEPTTIFGSAIGLCLGGWLKRKKLSQHNRTALQR
jgi:hypothetical protein